MVIFCADCHQALEGLTDDEAVELLSKLEGNPNNILDKRIISYTKNRDSFLRIHKNHNVRIISGAVV